MRTVPAELVLPRWDADSLRPGHFVGDADGLQRRSVQGMRAGPVQHKHERRMHRMHCRALRREGEGDLAGGRLRALRRREVSGWDWQGLLSNSAIHGCVIAARALLSFSALAMWFCVSPWQLH